MIDPNMKINWLQAQAECFPDKTFIQTSEKTLSYKQVLQLANSLSTEFTNKGISTSDRVAVISNDKLDIIFSVFALWQIGAIPVIMNNLWLSSEIIKTLSLNKIEKTVLQKDIEIDRSKFIDTIELNNILSYNAVATNQSAIPFSHEDEALILFTSGSTAAPKGVVYTFKNLLASFNNITSIFNLNSYDNWLSSLPLYHIGGFQIFIRALVSGCKITIPADKTHNELENCLYNGNITHASLVGKQLVEFTADKKTPPDNLEYVFLGGGPVSNTLIKQAVELGWDLVKVYGSSETSSMVTALEVSNHPDKIASSGKALGNVEIRINNNNGPEGEILIKCESVAKGYLEKGTVKPFTHNGFYHSGDLGYLDDDGFLFITGRAKRIIISGGENISAQDIEKVIDEHPLVLESFVYAYKDEKWGEAPAAALVFEENDRVDVIAVEDYLKEVLPTYKVPKKFIVLYNIPRNELGKIDMQQLMKIINSD